MTTVFNLLATVIGACIAMMAQGQPMKKAPSSQQNKPPVIKDWFLATGNWHNDPQLYVCEFGTGADTVVMLHGGWGGDHSGLLTAVADLGHQFHFILYDQRGSLRSPFPDSLISFNEHIEDVERLRKELNIHKLNLVGHSMGAVLASAYATRYPQHIQRLILLSPASLKNPLPQDEKELLDKNTPAFQAFLDRREVTQLLEKHTLHRKQPALSSREETMKFRINIFRRMVYHVERANEVMGGRALYKSQVFELTAKTYPAAGWNYVAAFKEQAYPVSIITGDHDFLDFGASLANKWAGEVPRIKLSIIKKAGHILWIDQPGEFEQQLTLHLGKQ